MLRTSTVLAVVLALSLFLAACGGSAEETIGDETSETSASAQPASDTPQPNPTPTEAPSYTPQAEPTPAESATGEVAPDDTLDIVEHLREKTMRLWDVYNTHDPDALEVFYEENYWKEEVEEIRSNMQPFKNLGLTFTAEETSPPTEIAPGKWEIKHTARFTGGLVNMVFIYEESGGDWLLTYAKPE